MKDDITSILKLLNSTKVHGLDKISVRLIKLCGDSIEIPPPLIFKFFRNIILVHKEEANNLVKNYRPVTILPILIKTFETLLINSLFFHIHNNDLFTKFQSGFIPDAVALLRGCFGCDCTALELKVALLM